RARLGALPGGEGEGAAQLRGGRVRERPGAGDRLPGQAEELGDLSALGFPPWPRGKDATGGGHGPVRRGQAEGVSAQVGKGGTNETRGASRPPLSSCSLLSWPPYGFPPDVASAAFASGCAAS